MIIDWWFGWQKYNLIYIKKLLLIKFYKFFYKKKYPWDFHPRAFLIIQKTLIP